MEKLSLAQARRVALAAQGLAGGRPDGAPAAGGLLRAIGRLGLLQLDSVNVLARAHYLPLFSRLGAYDRSLLDGIAAHDGALLPRRSRRLFEYWAHEASLLPLGMQPLLRWRMERAQRGEGTWSGLARWARANPQALERIWREVEARGRLGVSELSEAGARTGGWWGWNDGKAGLEWLFWTGRLTAAGRRGFERLYDLPQRVIPEAILALPTPEPAEAHRALMRFAAQALGVATQADLRDYFRLPVAAARQALAELVEAGELRPVEVEGWGPAAYLSATAKLPRRATGRALLAPFDPLIWERDRTERLFGFHYRIEIYTPADKRRHGYYVLPFLMGDRLVARVDLKSDRAGGRLLVRAAHAEDWADKPATAAALAEELRTMAGWLGLERVEVEPKGDLAPALLDVSGFRRAALDTLDDEPAVLDPGDADEGIDG